MLDAKSPTKFSVDPTDQAHQDIVTILDSFEHIFLAFLKQNYNSFTEKDCQKIIHDELRVNILEKLKTIEGGSFQNVDPFKI